MICSIIFIKEFSKKIDWRNDIFGLLNANGQKADQIGCVTHSYTFKNVKGFKYIDEGGSRSVKNLSMVMKLIDVSYKTTPLKIIHFPNSDHLFHVFGPDSSIVKSEYSRIFKIKK